MANGSLTRPPRGAVVGTARSIFCPIGSCTHFGQCNHFILYICIYICICVNYMVYLSLHQISFSIDFDSRYIIVPMCIHRTCMPVPQTYCHYYAHTLAHTRTHTHKHKHARTHSLSLTHSHTHSLTLTHSHTQRMLTSTASAPCMSPSRADTNSDKKI